MNGRRRLQVTVGALVMVAGVLIVAAMVNLGRPGLGQISQSPSESPTAVRSASPAVKPPPGSVGASPQPTASPAPTASPEPTIPPREGWSTVFTVEPGPDTAVSGVAEARGKLFALGRSGRTQSAIWVSEDGETWTAADVPPMTERLPGSEDSFGDLVAVVVDVHDAGDRLVALASVGLAEGSGLFGTVIYTSDDEGRTWTEVRSTPGMLTAAMFEFARIGDRLIAAGTAIWSSDDGGLSWTEAVDSAAIGGTMYAVDGRDDVVVAAGDGGTGDLTGPPAIALVSTDGGDTWERLVIDPDAGAAALAIDASSRVVIGGHLGEQLPIWLSDDAARTWEVTRFEGACCARDLVATPTGFVMAASGFFNRALLSHDGVTWTQSPLDVGLIAVDWGPRFGLVGASSESILFGPAPAP